MHIRITEEQYKSLQETIGGEVFLSNSEIPEYPQDQVYPASNKGNQPANPPITKNVSDTMAPQYPWGCPGAVGGQYYRPLSENNEGGISDLYNDRDQTGDGVVDKFNHADANILNNGDSKDDLTVIPYTIQKPLNALLRALEKANLPCKKQVMVLNLIIDKMNLAEMPPSYKKETILKIYNK